MRVLIAVVMPELKRIGYHRVSDDGVTSFVIHKSEVARELGGLKQDSDIDHIWTRGDDGLVDYYCDTRFGKGN